MPTGLERHHRSGYPHFITCSCFRHMPFLGASSERDLFLDLLRQTATKYQGELFAFVIMPDHFHLILGEPERGTIATILQVVKQRFSRALRQHRQKLLHGLTRRAGATDLISVWDARYYDYLIPNPDKFEEKLTYIHLNPVRRGLVIRAEDWAWSSCREYLERSARRYKDKDGADAPSPHPLATPKNGATSK